MSMEQTVHEKKTYAKTVHIENRGPKQSRMKIYENPYEIATLGTSLVNSSTINRFFFLFTR